ncbi:uncharacterized protein [Pocillopora verrucosa]
MMTLPENKNQKKNQKRKKKGKNIINSDSDEDPLPPKIRKATSVKKEDSSKANKSRRAISLDSDEEEVVASKEVQQVKES